MAAFLPKLNPEQRKGVTTAEGRVLILAGAGSGKTSVLTHRIAYLINNRGIDPSKIVGLTFTNKAAGEMRERVAKLIGPAKAKQVTLSTFHSFCLNILRKEIHRLGFTSQFSLYDEKDMKRLLKNIAREALEHEGELPSIEGNYAAIQKARNQGVAPENLEADKTTIELYSELDNALRAYNALDFDALLFLTVHLFEKFPDVLEAYQEKFHYFMIDEYQDTNPIQYRLADLLSKKRGNLCVVGDDDQSIYGWRGAEVEHILNFPYDTLVKLEQNYRSTSTVLNAANHVIKNNKTRHEKVLWSDKGKGASIEIFHKPTEEEEVDAVIERLIDLKTRENRPWSDFAILYRSNLLARPFERGLIRAAWKRGDGFVRGVPYRVFGGTELYERAEVKDLMAYLKVIANPQDQTALLRIINYPRRGISEKTLDQLTTYNRSHKIPLAKVIEAPPETLSISERGRGGLASFSALMKQAREKFAQGSLADSLTWLVETIEYKSSIGGEVKSEKAREFKWQGVLDAIEALKNYEEETENPSLADFVANTLLDKQSQAAQKGFDGVSLMTFHSSKGLEFPVCFLTCLEDHIIPHEKSLAETGLEEERRLMYVAITRCQHKLFLSMSRKRPYFGKEMKTNPSRFLYEIPKDLLNVTK